MRLVGRRPVRELSLRGAPGELGAGLLVGAGLFAAVMGVVWLTGGYGFTGLNGPGTALAALASALGAGFVEEVVFRGVLFRIVEEGLGTWISLALTAALFGSLHLMAPDATAQGAVAIALSAGVLLAAYVLTRRLWLAIGIHAAWNFVQGGVFGVSVSGNEARGSSREGRRGAGLRRRLRGGGLGRYGGGGRCARRRLPGAGGPQRQRRGAALETEGRNGADILRARGNRVNICLPG